MEEFANVYSYLGLLHKLLDIERGQSVISCHKIETLMGFLKSLDDGELEFFKDSAISLGREIAKRHMEYLVSIIDSKAWSRRERLDARMQLAALSLMDGYWSGIPNEEKISAMEGIKFGKKIFAAGNAYAHPIEGCKIDTWAKGLLDKAKANVESTISPQPIWRPKSGIPYTDISEKHRKTIINRVCLKLDTPRWPINLFRKIKTSLSLANHRHPASSFSIDEYPLGSLYGFLRYAHTSVSKCRPDVGHATAVFLLICLRRSAEKQWMQDALDDPDMKAELDNVAANAHAIIEHTRLIISPKVAESLGECYIELGIS